MFSERLGKGSHTRIGDSDLDAATLERYTIQREGLFQAFNSSELGVSKTLGSLQLAVLDKPNAGDLTILQKLAEVLLFDIVVEIP